MKTLVISLITFLAISNAPEVYITRTGKKYHTYSDCRALKNSSTVTKTTKEQAEKDGKTLCTWCKNKNN